MWVWCVGLFARGQLQFAIKGIQPLLVLDGLSGNVVLMPAIPPSTITDVFGSSQSCDCLTPVGQPIVDSDGSIYVEYEVRQISAVLGAPPVSSILWLLKIAPDGSTSTTQLSSSNNANLFPGNLMPDGTGGVVATWAIAAPNSPFPAHPYQAAHLSSFGGLTTYDLPMAPTQIVNGANGLPINFPMVLGENGTAFVSYGTNAVSFNLNTGAVNWNYLAAPQTGVSIISSAAGNALVAKTTNSGVDTVLRFDSTAAGTQDAWSASSVDYFIGNEWLGFPASGGDMMAYSAAPVDLSLSFWFAPEQKKTNRALPISVVLHFTGSKSKGDKLKFLDSRVECSESLGLADCTSTSGYWLWNLEGNAAVYDDAFNWAMTVSLQAHSKGFFKNANNNLQAFSCTPPPDPNDKPLPIFLQQPAGQKSIFYLDGPGPFIGVNPSDGCQKGTTFIDSETIVFNLQVNFTNKVTGFSRAVPYYVKTVIAPGHQADFANSTAGYGNISLNF